MSRFAPDAFLLLLLAAAGMSVDARAADITVYRCTDAKGHLTLRDTPCKKGETQQSREMVRPKDPPPGSRVHVSRPAPEPQYVEHAPPQYIVTTAPRPMYECVDLEGNTYMSDSAEGNPRWVELWALGYPVTMQRNPLGDNVGGPMPKPPGTGPGPPRLPVDIGLAMTPGSWIRDPCYALSPDQACEYLRDRRYELGRRYNSALQSERQRIDDEQRSIDARLESECTGY